MAGQLSEFISFINRFGVAKTSHFRLSVPVVLASKSGANFAELNKLLGLRCEATELPGRQLVANDSRTYGPTYKTPYQSLYQEITLNFLETSSFHVRAFFELWMSKIFNPETNMLAYPKTYRFPLTLIQYDVSDGSKPNSIKDPETPQNSLIGIAEWTLRDAFPTAVNQMPVSWSEDGFHRTTVTLAYEWYTLVTDLGAQQSAANEAGNATLKSPFVKPKGSAVS